MKISFNEWKVSGEVFYLKELQGEFAASLKIRGVAQRPDVFSSNVLEFPCLMTERVYDEARRKGIKQYMNVTLSGHLESWDKSNGKNRTMKIYFIADNVENLGGF